MVVSPTTGVAVGPLLADALERRMDDLIELWESCGASGPVLGSAAVEDPATMRAEYLLPLGRVLVGALRGSPTHAAVYLDERVRFVDPAISSADRTRLLREALESEAEAVASLVAADGVPRSAAIEVLGSLHQPLTEPPDAPLPVLLIGDCLFTETRAFLAPATHRSGRPLDIRHVYFSAGQRVDASGSAVVAEVRRTNPALIGLSLFTFDGVPPWSAAWSQASAPLGGRRARRMVAGLLDLVRETVEQVRAVTDSPIVVHAPCGLPLDRVRRRLPAVPAHSRAQERLLDALGRGLAELAAATPNTILLDEREVVRSAGGLRALGRPLFSSEDVPAGLFHTSRLGTAIATFYEGVVRDLELVGRAKAVFVDFDNTLWRGVMAEGDVVHDSEGQRLLKELQEAGILLVALSKNEPSAIRWEEMVLQPDDFVLQKVNWLPKPDNVSAAIRELDLGPDAFVLLDDNPVERALVTEQVPGVRALDPTEASTWRTLRRWLDFPSTKQTREAQRRTAMYREAAERRAAMTQGHDYAAMMRSLDLRYELRVATRADVPRLVELMQRTNQFNTTTRRRSQPEIEALLDDERYGVYVASLRDRFGDLGVVAAVVVEVGTRTFDSFIMSCRAMGFGLESAVLHDVMARHEGGPFVGLFIPTARNAPAADLWERSGFRKAQGQDDEGCWVLDGDRASWPQVPDWFRGS